MKRFLYITFALFAFAALVSRKGPDYAHYYDWSRAAATGDIFSLRGEQISPSGAPMSQWSHGPGFLLGFSTICTFGAVSEGASARISVGAAFLCIWLSLFGIAQKIAGSAREAVLYCSVAFLATHAGFYSLLLSSELFSLAALAALVYFIILTNERGLWRFAGGGAAAGILITTRPQLFLYAFVGFAILLFQYWRSPGRGRFTFPIGAALLCTPIAICAWQVAATREWMTGSALKSPYLFGDESFKGVDLTNPKLMETLFHPWHGLLLYHPIYIIAFGLLVIAAWRAAGAARAFLCAAAAALLVHLYHQASWYCWWLGLGSFGGRGMAAASIVLFPFLVRPRAGVIYKSIVGFCCVWSGALLWQGNSNYFTYGEFMKNWFLIFYDLYGWCAVVGATASILCIYNSKAFVIKGEMPGVVPRALAAVLILTFAVEAAAFIRLSSRTDARLSPGATSRAGERRAPFQLDALEIAAREYAFVAGFESEKERLAAFIGRARAAYK